jgi:hypothetical protein
LLYKLSAFSHISCEVSAHERGRDGLTGLGAVEDGFDLVKNEMKSINGPEPGKKELELGLSTGKRVQAQTITIPELMEAAA